MKKGGLTEKKMANKRFFKTERAIFIAYCKLRDYPSAKRIAQHAGISRTTLYRHHRKIYSIPDDYERYLLDNFQKTIRGFIKKGVKTKILYFRMLVFMMNNKDIITALFHGYRKEIAKNMIDCLKNSVMNEWRIGGDLDKMFNVYKNEVLGVIEAWAKQGFNENEIDVVLGNIVYLTKTARQRLLPLK